MPCLLGIIRVMRIKNNNIQKIGRAQFYHFKRRIGSTKKIMLIKQFIIGFIPYSR